jgi:hypothetical protein
MTSTIASRKNKARTLQKFVRDLILAHYILEPDDVLSTGMGQSGVDIKLSPLARKHFNFDVEAKNDENKSIWHCWQCTTDNEKKGKPLLFMKKNFKEALAIMRATDFMKILEELDKLKFPREKIICTP